MRPAPVRRVAVIGAGMAGAACAAGLRAAGAEVTVFDSAGGATAPGDQVDAFDPRGDEFTVTEPRFRSSLDRAVKLGLAAHWKQYVHAAFPASRSRQLMVPTSGLPALCRHLLGGAALRPARTVTGLQRVASGWLLSVAADQAASRPEGPFDQVVLAISPAEAALLLARQRPDWSQALAAARATPRWTLLAATDDVDWPWDSAVVDGSALATVTRTDRRPGQPPADGLVRWVAHATTEWSQSHAASNPLDVATLLQACLAKLLPHAAPVRWHEAGAHRWYDLRGARSEPALPAPLWDGAIGLGVCGAALSEGLDADLPGRVEAAWRSGDALADAMTSSPDAQTDVDAAQTPEGRTSPSGATAPEFASAEH